MTEEHREDARELSLGRVVDVVSPGSHALPRKIQPRPHMDILRLANGSALVAGQSSPVMFTRSVKPQSPGERRSDARGAYRHLLRSLTARLTRAQRDVLYRLLQGETIEEIAQALGRSVVNVEGIQNEIARHACMAWDLGLAEPGETPAQPRDA